MRAREAAVQVGRDHALARSERAVVRNRGGTKKEILMNFIPLFPFLVIRTPIHRNKTHCVTHGVTLVC